MPKQPYLQVTAAQCPKCLAVIISGYTHDYHPCPCKEIAIDGGRSYLRMAFAKKVPVTFPIECIGVTHKMLASDAYDEANALYFNHNEPSSASHKDVPPRKYTTVRTKLPVDPKHFRYTLNSKGKFYRYPKK